VICPACRKPYLFIDEAHEAFSRCLRCGHRAPFAQPRYENYHEELYTSARYRRDPATDPQMRRILRALRIARGERVLDIGCGVGDYTRALAALTPEVTGFDLSVESARRISPGLRFETHDSNRPLPLAAGSADVVVSVNLIEHLVSHELFLDECARVLKPGGRIALTTANRDFLLHDRFYDRTHVREWTLEQFGRLLERRFAPAIIEKSSGMFKWYPFNAVTTFFLKPDLLFVGSKR
jgi:SAM-dependent methyltransferase